MAKRSSSSASRRVSRRRSSRSPSRMFSLKRLNLKSLNLKGAGWCTPTIMVAVLGLLSVVALLIQLGTNKKKEKNENIGISLVSHIFWTLLVGAVLFVLCSSGKQRAAWWVFGVLYIVPIAIMFITLGVHLVEK